MKRKFLSLILIMFLLPGAFFISACSRGGGYNLKNLSKDFYSVANDKENDSIVKNDNKIIFNYSNYIYDGKTYMVDAINSYDVYATLKNYNYIYENILCFTFNFVEICSNNEVKIDKDIKNNLENKMNDLHAAIKDVALCNDILAGILKTTNEEVKETDKTCINRLKNILVSYETLFVKASKFNSALSEIYFNYLLTDSNPDIQKIEAVAFDSAIVVNRLEARKCWQISNLSSVYAELYVVGSNLSEVAIEGVPLDLNPSRFKYKDLVSPLNIDIKEDKAILIANDANNKLAFYQLSKQAYNAQTMLNIDRNKYNLACNKIDYAGVDLNSATNEDILCMEIIENYSEMLASYNKILFNMLDMIEVDD